MRRPPLVFDFVAVGLITVGYFGLIRDHGHDDGCDGGVGNGCTVDTRLELVHAANACGEVEPCVEWRVFDGTYWRRYRGTAAVEAVTPGAVPIGELP